MTFLQELVEKALNDNYLVKLINKAEIIYGNSFLRKECKVVMTKKEYFDLIRFADILSRDSESKGRNLSYKIISILYPFYKNDDYFIFITNSILTKLGNFPSLSLVLGNKNSYDYDTVETKLEKTIKEEFQKVPGNDKKVFTDAQYKLFEQIKNSNHFSFSGPTSFGKSFIMDAFINYVIEERHGIDNIIILVPTRALINQVSKRLKLEMRHNNYRVMTHPVVPAMFKSENTKYIFVFTPERMISYLAEKSNPAISYLFIDEAQKIIAQKDSRAPLYYQAVSMAERKSIKLYFASPNIPNSDIFLKLFDKSTDEQMVITEAPVAQNRFFIDFVDKIEIMFTECGIDYFFKDFGKYGNLNQLLFEIGRNNKNIVYCNSIEDTIRYALEFSKELPKREDERIDEVIKLIQEYIHKDYYLIDCLKKGIAFHFGKLPQRIRERVEFLFEEKALDYMFCTSTLLEGVNLPARNIFILNNTIGTRKFTDIDFWNLAGRAGRLSKELSGNIVCVRVASNKWKTKPKDIEMIRSKKIQKVVPTILKGEDNFYKNIENSLVGRAFTRKSATQNEIDVWNHYANIIFYQEIAKADSLLKSNYMKKNDKTSKKILAEISKNNEVPENILEQSTNIKAIYQNQIWRMLQGEEEAFSDEISTSTCYMMLEKMYKYYRWDIEESKGRNALVKDIGKLKYYAVLMYTWITSKPLNMIIGNIINYYKKKGEIWHNNEMFLFNANSQEQINWVINSLISDIDSMLRFKIKNYFSNYYLLVASKNGNEIAGADWSEYLEYGTTDQVIIDLQNVGLPRHLALLIKDNYMEYLVYDGSELVDIKFQELMQKIDTVKYHSEYMELLDICGINKLEQ